MASLSRLLLHLAVVARAAGFDSQPDHDGFTTYCWKTMASPLAKDLNESMKVVEAKGRECPIQLRLETGTLSKDGDHVVGVLEPLRVQWTAVAFDVTTASTNAVNLTRLYTIPTHLSSAVQIPHSNLHACEFGPRPCTPFDRGANPTDNTPNQEMNFIAGRAHFHETDLRFSKPGQYTLLAHVVLPGDVSTVRYDFVVYKKIVVKDVAGASGPPAPDAVPVTTTTEAGSSTLYTILGGVATLFVVAVVVIVVHAVQKRQPHATKHVDMDEPTTDTPRPTSRPSTRGDTVYSLDQTFSFAPSSEHSMCMAPLQPTFQVGLGKHYHPRHASPAPPTRRDQYHCDEDEFTHARPPHYNADRMSHARPPQYSSRY